MRTSTIFALVSGAILMTCTPTLASSQEGASQEKAAAQISNPFGEAEAVISSAADSGVGEGALDEGEVGMEIVNLRADDGKIVTAFIMFPAAGLDPASPGIVFHHGGPGGHGARLIGAGRYAAEGLARKGYTTITIVSRHSNGYIDTPLEESALDVEAAVRALQQRGVNDIVLVGNSMGSIRVALYMVHLPDPSIKAMVHVAPTYDLDDYTSKLSSIAGDAYEPTIQAARDAVARGEGRLPSPATDNPHRLAAPPLFQNGFGRPHTAEVFLNWWGAHPGRPNALMALVPDFHVPQLFMGGEADRVTPPARMKALAEASINAGVADYLTYPDGDHYFTGYQSKVIDDISAWLEKIDLAPAPRAKVRFLDNLQEVNWNGVMFTTRSPGLIYEPEGVDPATLRKKPALLLLPDLMGALLDEDMDDMARALAATRHAVIVPQLQSDGYRGSQNASFDRVRGDLDAWQFAAQKAGYGEIVGVGLGMGGVWLADQARQADDSGFKGFVLVDPPVSLNMHLGEAIGKDALAALTADAVNLIQTKTDRDRALHFAFQSPYVEGEEGLTRLVQYAPTFLEIWGPDAATNAEASIKQSNDPVLILAGPNRFYASPEKWQDVAAKENVDVSWSESELNDQSAIATAIADWVNSLE